MQVTASEKKLIVSTIKKHVVGNVVIYFFGSRTDGTATATSDLDVLMKGKTELDLATLALIRDDLEESSLPFKVDLHDYHRMSKKMFLNISEKLKKVS